VAQFIFNSIFCYYFYLKSVGGNNEELANGG